ncbi:MAG: DUF2849 domain-containing protein [Paracoccaceae bacterium]
MIEGDRDLSDRRRPLDTPPPRGRPIEDEAHAALRLLKAEAQKARIVGAYLADARRGAAGPEPVHFREAFRTRGPSNYAHGKQAEARHV